jgi:thioredoxin reductase (NADPH)
MKIYDMLIVGGGPGGYTAALYAARAGLSVALLEKLSAGGQMALTSEIDNYPGFPEGVDGFELGMQMKAGAERFGAETVNAEVFRLKLESEIKEAETSEGVFYGRTVVFATGANPRYLGVEKEQALTGKGLHYCAHCDGMFYRNKTVMVIGGGNTAAADALLLSRIAKKVILVHRRDTLRATKIYHEPLKKVENIEFLWNSAVSRLMEDGRVRGAVIRDLISGEENEVVVDGIFVSIGRSPATALVKDQLVLDEGGYIIADESTRTNIAGVFAVGDVRAKALRQIVTAVSDGAVAAHYADEYLAEHPL